MQRRGWGTRDSTASSGTTTLAMWPQSLTGGRHHHHLRHHVQHNHHHQHKPNVVTIAMLHYAALCIDPHHHCQHRHRHQHHHHYQHYQHEHRHLHKPNVVTIVQRLRAEELFVDVTLATADRQVRQLNPIPQYGAIPFRPSKPGHHKA